MVQSGLLGLLLLGLTVTLILLFHFDRIFFHPIMIFHRSTLVLEVKKNLAQVLVQTNGKDMVNAIK